MGGWSWEWGAQGATVPIEAFVSRQLSCFSAANRGYNGGGIQQHHLGLPHPQSGKGGEEGEEEREKEGLSILERSDPEWGKSAFP